MKAEFLKLRRTLIPLVGILAPLVPALLALGVFGRPQAAGGDWSVFTNQVQMYWALMMLPLTVSLLAAQLAAIEHSSGGWRPLLALPRRRSWAYLEKAGVLLVITAGMNAIAFLAALAVAWAIPHDFEGTFSIISLAGPYLLIWMASLAMTLLTLAVAVRFESFLAPSGLGAAAMVVGLILVNSDRLGPWWPWNLSAFAVIDPDRIGQVLSYSFGLSTIALIVGLAHFERRDA